MDEEEGAQACHSQHTHTHTQKHFKGLLHILTCLLKLGEHSTIEKHCLRLLSLLLLAVVVVAVAAVAVTVVLEIVVLLLSVLRYTEFLTSY